MILLIIIDIGIIFLSIIGTLFSSINIYIIWSLFLFISILLIIKEIKSSKTKQKDEQKNQIQSNSQRHHYDLAEKQELRSQGYDEGYLSDLGDRPELKHIFNQYIHYSHINNPSKAIASLIKCFNHPRSSFFERIVIAYDLGREFIEIKNYYNAEKWLNYSYKNIIPIANKENEPLLGLILENLGIARSFQYNIDSAHNYYKKAIRIFIKLGDKEGIVRIYFSLGNLFLRQDQYDEAIYHLDLSLKISRKYNIIKGILYSLSSLSAAYAHKDELELSLSHMKQMIELGEKNPHIIDNSIASINLAIILQDMGKAKEAIKIAHESIKKFKKRNDIYHLGLAYNALGLSYRTLGKFDNSLKAFHTSISYLIKAGDINKVNGINMNVGAVYLDQNKFQEAVLIFNKFCKSVQKAEK